MATRPSTDVDDRSDSDTQESELRDRGVDTQRAKRAAAAVIGGILLIRGLRRRSLRGVLMAIVGGVVASRALGDDSRLKGMLDPAAIGAERFEDLGSSDPASVSRSVTVGRPAEELYEAWRDPERLSRIMGHFAEVTRTDEENLRWSLTVPWGRDVSWETRFVEEDPGELLRWETGDDAPLPNTGTVRFSPSSGDRGTKVTLTVNFDPPGGDLGNATLRQLDIVPKSIVGEALRRFKSHAETGEIQTLEANPSARGTGDRI